MPTARIHSSTLHRTICLACLSIILPFGKSSPDFISECARLLYGRNSHVNMYRNEYALNGGPVKVPSPSRNGRPQRTFYEVQASNNLYAPTQNQLIRVGHVTEYSPTVVTKKHSWGDRSPIAQHHRTIITVGQDIANGNVTKPRDSKLHRNAGVGSQQRPHVLAQNGSLRHNQSAPTMSAHLVNGSYAASREQRHSIDAEPSASPIKATVMQPMRDQSARGQSPLMWSIG